MDYLALIERSAVPRLSFFIGSTGLAPVAQLSLNGRPFAASSRPVTEIGLGFYYLDLVTTETNDFGNLVIQVTSTDPPVQLVVQVRSVVQELLAQVRKAFSVGTQPLVDQLNGVSGLIRSTAGNLVQRVMEKKAV